MPKVLRILNRLNIGGPTYNVAYLSKYINAQYETKLLAGNKDPHEGSSEYLLNDLNVPFEYVPDMFRSIHLLNDHRVFRSIQKSIISFEPDIVHTHAAKAGVLGRLAAYYCVKRPKAIVHTYHGNVFDGYFSFWKTQLFLVIERYLASISNAIIAISDQQKDDLVNKYAVAPANKVHVIKLGFDLNKFTENMAAKRAAFRSLYGLDDSKVVITITGRIAPVKDHFFFIEALKTLRHNNPALKFKVFVVGDGELYDAVVLQAQLSGFSTCLFTESNYAADIIFTSWRKDIDVINAGSDIIALTSLNEGTPVSIIEALASAKGVICTNVGGVKDVVADGYSGFLCDRDAGSFAQKLEILIVDEQLRFTMAANGKAFALKNYSYERLVKETEDLYQFLLEKRLT